MGIVVNSPIRPRTSREELFAPFESLLDRFINEHQKAFNSPSFAMLGSYPKLDIIEYPNRLELHSEIPGLNKENVRIECDATTRTLAISGDKREDTVAKDGGMYIHRELKHSCFRRSFRLPEDLDLDDIDAEFKDGLLKIVVKRKETSINLNTPKVVNIK